ncbi:hypothetical protein ACFQ60_30240 [Streptomyces zhihengii]
MTVTRLPADPTDADVDHWHAVLRAAHLHDLADSVPPPSRTDSAGRLRKPSARTRTVHFAVPAAEGAGYDGVATLVLFGEADNRHTAFVDAFAVHPRARKHGAGSLLWGPSAPNSWRTDAGRCPSSSRTAAPARSSPAPAAS